MARTAPLRRSEVLIGELADQSHERARVVSLLSDAVAKGEFSEDSLREVAETMTAIQRANAAGRTVGGATWWNYIDEAFVYSRLIHATPFRAAELNEALADKLSERAELMDDLGTKFVALVVGRGVVGQSPKLKPSTRSRIPC